MKVLIIMDYISLLKELTAGIDVSQSLSLMFRQCVKTFESKLMCDFIGFFQKKNSKLILSEYHCATSLKDNEQNDFSILDTINLTSDYLIYDKENNANNNDTLNNNNRTSMKLKTPVLIIDFFSKYVGSPINSLLILQSKENGFWVQINKNNGVFSKDDISLGRIISNLLLYAEQREAAAELINHQKQTNISLSRYFSYNILQKIKEGQIDRDKCIEADITVMFVQIKGFISLSRTLTPTQSIHMLNHYFRSMVNIIQQNDGTIDKYIQEKMLAYWGFPFQHCNDAVLTVLTAIAMKNEIKALKKRQYIPEELALGIGINKGKVVLGNLGSDERMEFTIIGDTVNVAARLCEIAPKDDIIISRSVTEEIFNNIRTIPFGTKVLDGKSTEINTYRIDFLRKDFFDIYLSVLKKKNSSGGDFG